MKPIIMAVEGYALAGGTEILQGTDIRVAAEDTIFGVTECKRGLFPLGGSTIRLRRQIPYALAAEDPAAGSPHHGAGSIELGLDQPHRTKRQSAGRRLENRARNCGSKTAHSLSRAITRSLRENQQDLSEKEALAKEEQLGWPVLVADAKEGMKAFKEKRKPVFTGK